MYPIKRNYKNLKESLGLILKSRWYRDRGRLTGVIDQGCMKSSLGIPSLGKHTALGGERLVLSGTPLEEGHLIQGS